MKLYTIKAYLYGNLVNEWVDGYPDDVDSSDIADAARDKIRSSLEIEVTKVGGEVRVLVCGGRDFGDFSSQSGDGSAMPLEIIKQKEAEREFFNKKMDEIFKLGLPELVIEGGAKGADTCAFWWAKSRGVPVRTFRADWDKEGKKAGILRNQRMLDEGLPDLVVAFPGGEGTADMVKRAKDAGIDVIEVTYQSEAYGSKREKSTTESCRTPGPEDLSR